MPSIYKKGTILDTLIDFSLIISSEYHILQTLFLHYVL